MFMRLKKIFDKISEKKYEQINKDMVLIMKARLNLHKLFDIVS